MVRLGDCVSGQTCRERDFPIVAAFETAAERQLTFLVLAVPHVHIAVRGSLQRALQHALLIRVTRCTGSRQTRDAYHAVTAFFAR